MEGKYLMKKKLRGSKVYRNFIISYIITLLFPMLIMSFLVLYNFVNTLKDEVEINLTNSFKKSVDHFETQMEQLQKTSLQIELNSTFKATRIIDKPYNAIDIKKEIAKYNTNSFVSEIYIYHYDDNYVSSSSFLYSLEDFYQIIVPDRRNGFDLLEFREALVKNAVFLWDEKQLDPNGEINLIYINKIPAHSSKHYASIIYLIPQNSLQRIFSASIVTNDSYVFIKDLNSNKILLSFTEKNTVNKTTEIEQALSAASNNNMHEIKINGKYFSIFSLQSKGLGLEFIQLLPKDLLTNKINKIRTVFILGMVVIVLLSGFIIAILMRINYRPIENLKKLIESTMPASASLKDSFNEIEVLEHAFLQYNRENKSLQELAKNNNSVVQQYLIDCFLLGQAKEIENIHETCKQAGLHFDKDYYCVMVLKASKADYGSKIQSIGNILNSLNNQNQMQYFIKKDISFKKIIILVGSNVNSEETCKRYALTIMHQLKDKYDDDIKMGIGSYVQNIFDIYLSYQEALKVLDYNQTVSKSFIMNISELSQVGEPNIKYPFKIFDNFESSIRQKDVLKIQELVNKLILFIKTENVPLYWAKNICYDVVNTIFRELLMTNNYSSTLNKPYIEKIYGAEINTFDDIEEILDEIVSDLTNFLNVGEGTYELKLLQQITDYIRENYCDPDFSLQKLADSIQMSPPYVSQYFKNNTNYTISDYVTRLRMKKAKELLVKTKMSIHDIAPEVGYYSVSSFIRKFKEIENITPGQYKKKYS